MQVINYNKVMNKICSELNKAGVKPKLLLHSCCAPCSTSCIERLKDYFEITIFYFNPNIDSKQEYSHRLQEQEYLCKEMGVELIKAEYNSEEFYNAVSGFESDFEGGKRCEICYALRLNKTAEKAKELGFAYFATTLTVSPLKSAEKLNYIGVRAEDKYGVKYLCSDFKKDNGYHRSVELSNKFGLYRQNYCGCTFSKAKNPVESL